MTVEHLQIQQPIVENNKLKEEIQLQSKKQRNTTGKTTRKERNTTAIQEAVKKYNWKNNKKWLTDTGTVKFSHATRQKNHNYNWR